MGGPSLLQGADALTEEAKETNKSQPQLDAEILLLSVRLAWGQRGGVWGVLPEKGLEGVLVSPRAAGTADPRVLKRQIYKNMGGFM